MGGGPPGRRASGLACLSSLRAFGLTSMGALRSFRGHSERWNNLKFTTLLPSLFARLRPSCQFVTRDNHGGGRRGRARGGPLRRPRPRQGHRDGRGHQARVSQARPAMASRQEPRRRRRAGEVQGDLQGVLGARRRQEAGVLRQDRRRRGHGRERRGFRQDVPGDDERDARRVVHRGHARRCAPAPPTRDRTRLPIRRIVKIFPAPGAREALPLDPDPTIPVADPVDRRSQVSTRTISSTCRPSPSQRSSSRPARSRRA